MQPPIRGQASTNLVVMNELDGLVAELPESAVLARVFDDLQTLCLELETES